MSDRLLPSPVGLNGEFYAFLARGELRLQRCAACNAWQHPPRHRCAHCGSGAVSWEPATGRGRVYSWTVTHQAPLRAFAGRAPYAVLVVELEEGVRMVAGLADARPDQLELDLPVEVVFERITPEAALPQFRPRGVA